MLFLYPHFTLKLKLNTHTHEHNKHTINLIINQINSKK